MSELHGPVHEREQRIVAGSTDVLAGMNLGSALTNDDAARGDARTVEHLHAKPLRI